MDQNCNQAQAKASCVDNPRPETDGERYARYLADAEKRSAQLQLCINTMSIEVVRLRQALLFIQDWRFPQAHFAINYGANGEREFMRAVATNALNGIS